MAAAAECLPGTSSDETASSRLQWLRQRKETLEEKLAKKNSELKALCIEEAELTGVLPPEIPLEPGEDPPVIRKRPASTSNQSQNLIQRLRNSGTEESALEIEKQAQIHIAEAALAVLNDPSESKAARRKNRAIYQQSQRRLQELNTQLNFLRQGHGSMQRHSQPGHVPLQGSKQQLQSAAARHRPKKPRPPLENSGKDLSPMVESRNLLQEPGINLSPMAPEHNFNVYQGYDYQDLQAHSYPQGGINPNRATYHAPSPSEHRRSDMGLIGVSSSNNNIYVPPDQFRARTYSQGGGNSSISPHLYPERQYRPIMPNTYTEEERQIMYRQMKMKKQESAELRSRQHSDQRYQDNEAHRRSTQVPYNDIDYSGSQYDGQTHDPSPHLSQAKTAPLDSTHLRKKSDNSVVLGSDHSKMTGKSSIDTYVPPGYWMRLDDEIVWCSEEQAPADRFGSLDRRKQSVAHHHSQSGKSETQSRYHTVALGSKNVPIPHSRSYPAQVHSPDNPAQQQPQSLAKSTGSRALLRTQSLGSVEGWQASSASCVDGSSSTAPDSIADPRLQAKPKEKEWIETSLDTAPRLVRRASQHNPPTIQVQPQSQQPPMPHRERAPPVRSNSIPSNRRPRLLEPDELHQHQQPRPPVPRFVDGKPRVLEIPAESKPSPGSQENGNDTIATLNSPTNHTVVQPGKYQPYREITKPFEMSDFYKYSTKFRKKVDGNVTNDQSQLQQQSASNLNTQKNQKQSNHSVQRITQPVQRNQCPTYPL
ncbi:hypothetical protein QAD02_017627 [Eretmocerus hayati]|uniref:Uncharacterized protein n=1 Tax=Eretmocerus hayati TaxID=131215 RepID=A0ACC2PE50_9HYME|nr:hypothetical protein QAD02_017627 [Eretmocerus hayati]